MTTEKARRKITARVRDAPRPRRRLSRVAAEKDSAIPSIGQAKETTTVMSPKPFPVFKDPPNLASYNADDPEAEDWLPTCFLAALERHKPKQGDIDPETGKADKDKLKAAAGALLAEVGIGFCNYYQLKQLMKSFGSEWGFTVGTVAGWQLHCSYGVKTKAYTSQVSPGKQRAKASLKVGCGFKIMTSPRSKASPKIKTPVKITQKSLEHTDSCEPGVDTLIIAKRASGEYFSKLDLAKLTEICRIINAGPVNANTLRMLLRDHIPDKVPITSTDVHNVRARVFKLMQSGDINLDVNEATKIINFSGLESNEMVKLGTDVSAQKAREFLRQTLQQTDAAWKVPAYLDLLSKNDPYFDYRIARNESQAPIGVVWISKTMREDLLRFGEMCFLDAMKRQLNVLHWKYISPTVLDHEFRAKSVSESLFIEEDLDNYAFVINAMFEMEPLFEKQRLRLIFADGFISDSLLPKIGLARETTHVFSDHFHLETHVNLADPADAACADLADAASVDPSLRGKRLASSPLTDARATKKRATKQPQYKDFMEAAGQLAGIVQSDASLSQLAYGALMGIVDTMRGQTLDLNYDADPSSQLLQIVSTAQIATAKSATSKKVAPTGAVPPVPATVSRGGAPKSSRMKSQVMEAHTGRYANSGKPGTAKCSFCGNSSTHRNITTCPERRKHGKHITCKDLTIFLEQSLAASQAKPLHPGVATQSKPILQTLPASCKWLVVHQVYILNVDAGHALADTRNIGILVTCLGANGSTLPHGSSTPAEVVPLERWLATHTAVTAWIGKHGKKGGKKLSAVLSTIDDENRRSMVPSGMMQPNVGPIGLQVHV